MFFILIVSLFFIGAKPAFAQASKLPNQAQSPREMILKSPIGRRVKITLLSDQTFEGGIAIKDPSYCIILLKPDRSPFFIDCSNIKKIHIYNDSFRKEKHNAFDVIKAPVYVGISIVKVTYWIASELFESIFGRGRSN